MSLRGFYGVVDATRETPLEGVRALVAQLLEGGAAIVQVRMKRGSTASFVALAREARALTARAGVPLIVNDRLDVALAVGAQGVHLGQDDLPIDAALGRGLIVGISTHTVAQAGAAARAGADYVAFGPVYATSTKENPDPVQGVDALAAAVRAAAPTPVVAIGGITPERAREIAAAGAAAACAISSVNGAPDVAAAARRIARAWLP